MFETHTEEISLFIWITFSFEVVCLIKFIAQKMSICSTFVSNAPFALSVERGANNGKVVYSRLIRTRFHFLFRLVSLFK